MLIILLIFFPICLIPSSSVKLPATTNDYRLFICFILGVILAYVLSIKEISLIEISYRYSYKSRALLGFCLTILFFELLYFASSLGFNANTIDEFIYLFQASTFSNYKLYLPVPQFSEFYSSLNVIIGDKWYGQYPPLWPLFLSLGEKIGSYFIVQILLTLYGGYYLYLIVQNILSGLEEDKNKINLYSSLAIIFLAASPFYLGLGASFLSHLFVFVILSRSLLLLFDFLDSGRRLSLVFSFLLVSSVFLVRPYCGLIFIVAISPAILLSLKKNYFSFFLAAVAALLPIIILLCYNDLTNENPLLFGYEKLWGKSHSIGLGKGAYGAKLTLLTGITNQVGNLKLLGYQLLSFGFPVFIIFYLVFFLLIKGQFENFKDLTEELQANLRSKFFLLVNLSITFSLGYIFYWHNDHVFGPRLIFNSILGFAPLLIVSLYLINKSNLLFYRNLFSNGVLIAILISLTAGNYFYADQLENKLGVVSGVRGERLVEDFIKSKNLGKDSDRKSIIFIKVPFGARVISKLLGVGISPALVEQAYRSTDICKLSRLADNYLKLKYDTDSTIASGRDKNQLINDEKLLKDLLPFSSDKVLKVPTSSPVSNGDSSLRLEAGKLPDQECYDEIKYDRSGYTNYPRYLKYNAKNINLMMVSDLRSFNSLLQRVNSDTDFYLFDAVKITAINLK